MVLPESPNPVKRSLLKKSVPTSSNLESTPTCNGRRFNSSVGTTVTLRSIPFLLPRRLRGRPQWDWEIVEDLPEVDEVYVSIGGGGLISGIALAIKELHPRAKVYGVEPEHSNAMAESVRHQKLVV